MFLEIAYFLLLGMLCNLAKALEFKINSFFHLDILLENDESTPKFEF